MPVRWLTDDRPASALTRAYVAGMRARRDKKAFSGGQHTRETALERQRHGDAPPTLVTRLRVRIRTRRVRGTTVWRAGPRRGAVRGRVLYLHGGGYVHPLTPDYWRLVRRLVRAGQEVWVPAYPLAPAATVDEVLPLLVDLASDVTAAGPTVVMGDSAGGALALVVAGRLRDLGLPAPAGVVCLSPWLDATLSDPAVADLEPTDPMLAESGLRAAGRWWAGEHGPDDPLVSPVWMELDGLPPVTVMIGDHDILRPAVDRLAGRADHADVDLTVLEVSAMFHVWMTRAVPEGRRARRQLAELVATAVSRARGTSQGRSRS